MYPNSVSARMRIRDKANGTHRVPESFFSAYGGRYVFSFYRRILPSEPRFPLGGTGKGDTLFPFYLFFGFYLCSCAHFCAPLRKNGEQKIVLRGQELSAPRTKAKQSACKFAVFWSYFFRRTKVRARTVILLFLFC